MDFNIKTLDQEKLTESSLAESKEIFENKKSYDNRTYDDILLNTRNGHAVERYLIENFNYVNNIKKYHDVISPNNIEVECKVINHKWCNDYTIIQDPKEYNLKKWIKSYKSYNSARYICVFSVDDINENFKYYNTFDLETGEKVELPK